MSNKLTPQQEAFAQSMAKGMRQSEAYRVAYPKSELWKNETVWARASEMMADGKVIVRVNELKGALVEKELWSREQSVAILADIALAEDSRKGDRIKAVSELNRMHGFEAPTKIEHSGDLSIISVLRELDAKTRT